jgi:hypothetical protein
MLRAAQGRRPLLVYFPRKVFQGVLALAQRIHTWERLAGELVVDTTKLQSLGWYPPTGTSEGLRSMLAQTN